MTLCTYCVRTLKVPGRTVLTDSNTYANARSLPPVQSSETSPRPHVRHNKCHEASWRDSSSLLGFKKRNHGTPLPPDDQPSSATTSQRTSTAEAPTPLISRKGEKVARDAGDAEMKAGPTELEEASDIRVKKGRLQRHVSWGEDQLHLFPAPPEGESAGSGQFAPPNWRAAGTPFLLSKPDGADGDAGDCTAWLTRSSANRSKRSTRFSKRSTSSSKRSTKNPFAVTTDIDGGGQGAGDDGKGENPSRSSSSLDSCPPQSSTTNNPFAEEETVRGRGSGKASPQRSTNPFVETSACDVDGSSSSSSSSRAQFETGSSLVFPVLPRKEGWDGWSTPSPESRPTRSVGGGEDKPTQTGECGGEGEEPPPTSKSGFFAWSRPKMAGGAMAVIGVAATVGVLVLRRRR